MKIRKILLLVICLLTLITSVFLLNWTWQILTGRYLDDVIHQVVSIAAGFDSVIVGNLAEGESDPSTPAYLQIRNQLLFIENIFPNVQGIYLLKQNGDSQPVPFMEVRDDESQVGLAYISSSDVQQVFISGEAIIKEPVAVDQGTVLAVFVPLMDPFSGDTISVLGIILDASDWQKSTINEFDLPLLSAIVLNLSVLGLMAFLNYIIKARQQPKLEVLARIYLIVFTGLIGACITILSVWYVSFFERDSRNKIFQQLSMEKANTLAVALKDIDRFSLKGLEEFFLGSDFVSREEFSQYSLALTENQLVSAWVWVPEVTAVERLDFEESLLADVPDVGGIWQYDSDNNPVSSGYRDNYFPIEYITPMNEINSNLIGFNLDTCQGMGIDLQETLQVGLTVGSVPVNALCGHQGEYLLVLRPVQHSSAQNRQTGFVAAFINVDLLFQVTQLEEGLGDSAIYLDFIQYTQETPPYLLVSNSPEEMANIHLETNLQTHDQVEFTFVQPIFVYGNTYAVVIHPSPDFAKLYPATSGIILALSGSMLTIALMFFVNDTSSRNIILARMVRQRTNELSASEERLRLASESVKLGVYDIRAQTWEVVVNDVYAEMLGYDPEIFSETYDSWLSRLHPDDRSRTRKTFESFMQGVISEYKAEFRLKTAENDWIWVLSTAMVVEWDEQDRPLRVLGSHLDITTSKKATAKIIELLGQSNRRLNQMETLREIDKAIISDYDLDQILHIFMVEAKQQLEIDIVAIFLYDEAQKSYRYANSIGLIKANINHLYLSRHNSLAGRAANYGRPIHTQSFQDLVEPSFVAVMEEEGIKDCFVFSLIAQGKIKGAMEFWHRSLKIPDAEWMKFAETLAGQAAIAIEYSQLLSGLREANRELTRAYDATIEGWSLALDLKDRETEGHTQRVTDLTVELAKRVGLQEEALSHIRRGALLHDIGKMGIPDAILLKPDLLTDEERASIQNHPKYAYDMLKSIDYLIPALDIPYLHHEKWDGTGYPLGLKGTEIPIAARLFALVDVFDALTNDRPYRPAWSIDKALVYIEENSGIHFDPEMTPIFIKLIREELEIN